MKRESISEKVIYNGNIINTLDMKEKSFFSEPYIYEVIRLIDGVPLFLEDHLDRIEESFKVIGGNIYVDKIIIKESISKLVECTNIKNNNIKIIYGNIESKKPDYYIFFIKSNYPSEEAFINGIKVSLYNAERENPNAKIINTSLREGINSYIEKNNAFEALLVDNNNQITEGSRSNFFYILNNTIYTAEDSKVLKGITRVEIIKIIEELNIPFKRGSLNIKDIEKLEGAFITGTSIKALPIKNIDALTISTPQNIIYKNIIDKYNTRINSYIKENLNLSYRK